MKKVIVLCMIASLVMVSAAPVLSAQTPADKLGRGLANTLTGIFAIPHAMQRETDQHGIMAGLTTGLVKGLGWFVVREVVGVYEIVTFPFPVPEGYQPILTDPEYLL